MITIHKKNKEVNACLGRQEYSPWKNYKQSAYVYTLPIDNGTLMYNLLTREIILLDSEEELDIPRLVNKWFYVPDDIDERSIVYAFWQNFYTAHPRRKRPLRTAVIFTTTECNACCEYCYERGTSINRMTKETAKQVADYILRESGDNKVFLKWFGGEPLVNTEVIDLICNRLRISGKEFESDMVTNGFLLPMTQDFTLTDVWNLKAVQITIDGTEAEYERIKGIHGLYKIVTDSIERLARLGIMVDIRTHVTKDNGKDIKQLVQDLDERFGDIEGDKIHLYAAPIFEYYGDPITDEEREHLYDSLIEITGLIEDSRIGRKHHIHAVKGTHCMADSDCSIAIAPTGNLTPCEHYHDTEIVGNIVDGAKIPAKWYEHEPEKPECGECFYYPQCNMLKMCNAEQKCNEQTLRYTRYITERTMLNTYEDFFKRGRSASD